LSKKIIINFNIINQINHTYLPNAMPNAMRLDTLEVFRRISKWCRRYYEV